MDLYIDQDALKKASSDMAVKCQELKDLRKNIEMSFQQLKTDWDTGAGKAFFERFERDVLGNLDKYSDVFEHISANLSASSEKYDEVFRAADAVANSQY